MTSTIAVQVVVYDNHIDELLRLSRGLGAALRHTVQAGLIERPVVLFGDSSPTATIDADDFTRLQEALGGGHDASCDSVFFGENLGSGGGSNRLMAASKSDLIWVLNPDTVPTPGVLTELIAAIEPDEVAAVDARQVPIEHPKGFDAVTGDAPWVAGACLLLRRSAAAAVDGFDPHFFPMYCDDVDLSWRLRLAGWRVRHAPAAVVFHDKRLDVDGRTEASEFEHESGVLSRLFLAHRYGRPDIVAATLQWVDERGDAPHRRAAVTYRERLDAGDVPDTLSDPDGVSDLDTDYYGPSRFSY